MAVKEKVGIVVSDKMVDTRIVAVSDRITHKRYKKVVTRTKRYAVHDSEFNSRRVIKFGLSKLLQLVRLKLGQLLVF